jgi:hypothetical protein
MFKEDGMCMYDKSQIAKFSEKYFYINQKLIALIFNLIVFNELGACPRFL